MSAVPLPEWSIDTWLTSNPVVANNSPAQLVRALLAPERQEQTRKTHHWRECSSLLILPPHPTAW